MTFQREGVEMAYGDRGIGLPVVFQHCLGGDDAQISDIFPDKPATRRITLECRGQGNSAFGSVSALSTETLTEDTYALAQSLDPRPTVDGGISMGAAIALRLAAHHPEQVHAVILARRAWVTVASPANMKPYGLVGELLQRHAPEEALQRFDASETALHLSQHAPGSLASLRGFA